MVVPALAALEWVGLFRDIAIILMAVIVIGAMLGVFIVVRTIAKKTEPIIDSAKVVADNAKVASTLITERIVRPMTGGPGLMGSVRQIFESVERFFKKDGRNDNDRER